MKLLSLAAAAMMTVTAAPCISAADYGWQEINGSKRNAHQNKYETREM